MTALTAAARIKFRGSNQGDDLSLTVATGATLWRGALVNYDLAGRVQAATAATGVTFAGIALETKTGNTGGTVVCKVRTSGMMLIDAAAALTNNYLNSNACVADSGQVTTASDAGTAGVQVRVGRVTQFESGDVWVDLNKFSNDDV